MRLFAVKRRGYRGFAVSAAVFAAMLLLFAVLLSSFSSKAQEEEQAVLIEALRRACVSCYAIEGRYPESLEYMKKHYGVAYNEEKYIVLYDVFASNVFPSIAVMVKGASPL